MRREQQVRALGERGPGGQRLALEDVDRRAAEAASAQCACERGFVDVEGMNSWGQPVTGAWTNADALNVAALAYTNSDLLGGPGESGVIAGATMGGFDGDFNPVPGI